jgi:hypothetical protein
VTLLIETLRVRHLLFVVAALAASLGAMGCDDDPTTDGGLGDAGVDPVDGAADAGTVDAEVSVTIRGTVFIEDALDRMLDGGVTPWPDGGPPDGAALSPGGRVLGASVHLRSLEGGSIAATTTDATGAYSLLAPADTLTFLHVDPILGYAGQIRAEATRGSEYVAYDVVLSEESGLDDAMSSVGIVRDLARGLVACGFNPVDDQAGGDGAELGAGIAHDPAFNLTEIGSILGNRLVPLCQGDGSNPPGALPGATCTPSRRAKQVFFPNVSAGFAPVTPLDPASGACSLRFPIPEWLVAPNCVTVVNIDCAP